MAGSNDYESARIDMIADRVDDMHVPGRVIVRAKDVDEMVELKFRLSQFDVQYKSIVRTIIN